MHKNGLSAYFGEACLEDAVASLLNVKVDFAIAIQGPPYLDERVHLATRNLVIGQAPITDAYPDTPTC